MNIKEFQEKLNKTVQFAQNAGNQISVEQTEKFFLEDDLDEGQMEKVYEYLTAKKIQVTGRKMVISQSMEEAAEEDFVQADPLDEEDQSYLMKYKETLNLLLPSNESLETLLEKCIHGDEAAKQKIIEYFMPKVVDIAIALHHKEVSLADTISEGNMYLIMTVNRIAGEEKTDSKENAMDEAENKEHQEKIEKLIEQGIQDGIEYMIEEQTEQKRRDHSMVEKVERLENAIKELTDEDEKLEFSVDELAIFLDMSKEEIENVLRLAGEDK